MGEPNLQLKSNTATKPRFGNTKLIEITGKGNVDMISRFPPAFM